MKIGYFKIVENWRGCEMNYIELIKERHSVRNYLDQPIETEKIERLKEKLKNAM